MGQGPITSLAQQIADELDVTYESVTMIMGDTELCPYDMGTWGSLTTRDFSHSMRAAGAEAKAVLLELGADALKLDKSERTKAFAADRPFGVDNVVSPGRGTLRSRVHFMASVQ